MGYPITLGVAAGVALVGAGLGVEFGRSAIAQIDPVFYEWDTEYRSFAQYSAAHAGDYGEEAGLGVNEAVACVGCAALGPGRPPWLGQTVFSDAELGVAQEVPVYATAADTYEGEYREEAAYEEAEPLDEAPERPSAVTRYAYYAVDAAEGDETAPAAEPAYMAATVPQGESAEPVGM
jgi:hypothetical protein